MLRSRDSLYLTEQLNHEYRRAGITFRIMLIGESGLGKSTFTRALLRPYVPEHMLDEPAGSVATDALRDASVGTRMPPGTEVWDRVPPYP